MATKIREYVTKLPFSVHEWRKGQRYVLAKYTTDDVEIIGVKKREEAGRMITESHKIISMGKWLPMMVKKILNENALLVEEFSTNIDVFENGVVNIKEKVKTGGGNVVVTKEQKGKRVNDIGELKEGDVKEEYDKKVSVELRVEGKGSGGTGSQSEQPNSTQTSSKDTANDSSAVTVESSCDTNYINKYYDTGTFTLSLKTVAKDERLDSAFGTEPDKIQKFDLSNGKDGCYLYRYLTVTVNSMMLGWLADRIKNSVRDMLNKFHEKVIETEEEWKNIKEEELKELEEDMIRTFIKNV